MNPQLVAASKLVRAGKGNVKSLRRSWSILAASCCMAFASQAARAEDAATDLLAQLDSVAKYCSEHASSKGDYRTLVSELLPQASASQLERIRESADYKRIAQWDQSKLSSDPRDASAACASLAGLAAPKVRRVERDE